jgi:hypothetical protein
MYSEGLKVTLGCFALKAWQMPSSVNTDNEKITITLSPQVFFSHLMKETWFKKRTKPGVSNRKSLIKLDSPLWVIVFPKIVKAAQWNEGLQVEK